MIDPYHLWERFAGRVNIPQGGAVKPHRDFIGWVNGISISLYEEKFEAWSKSQKIIDDLSRPFLKTANLPVQDVSGANYGVVKFPVDYGHYSSARYYTKDGVAVPQAGHCLCDTKGDFYEAKECPSFLSADLWEILKSESDAHKKAAGDEAAGKYEEFPIDKVTNDRWGALLQHRRKKPSRAKPKCTDNDNGLKVAPAGIGIIVLDYLKKPEPCSFEYKVIPGNPTTGEGDVMVYDPVASKKLEWSELVINEFVNRLIKNYGQFFRENFMFETGEMDRQKTV